MVYKKRMQKSIRKEKKDSSKRVYVATYHENTKQQKTVGSQSMERVKSMLH